MPYLSQAKLTELGSLIKEERLRRGMDLTQLGWACGLKHMSRSHLRSMLSRLESGKRCPKGETLAKIVDYLGIRLLLSGEKPCEKEVVCPRCLHRHKIALET